jgi:hypothetical protein
MSLSRSTNSVGASNYFVCYARSTCLLLLRQEVLDSWLAAVRVLRSEYQERSTLEAPLSKLDKVVLRSKDNIKSCWLAAVRVLRYEYQERSTLEALKQARQSSTSLERQYPKIFFKRRLLRRSKNIKSLVVSEYQCSHSEGLSICRGTKEYLDIL